jgi:hypothetical protein
MAARCIPITCAVLTTPRSASLHTCSPFEAPFPSNPLKPKPPFLTPRIPAFPLPCQPLPIPPPPPLQRAKVLHPDLNSTAGQEEAQQNFLRLVAAYEVLSDAQQRRLYDTATDTQAPRAVRRAAARQQAAAAAGAASHTEPDAGECWEEGVHLET